ncbi:MAG: hypothetical protein ABIJ81_01250 [Patescibacteria group bacterium]
MYRDSGRNYSLGDEVSKEQFRKMRKIAAQNETGPPKAKPPARDIESDMPQYSEPISLDEESDLVLTKLEPGEVNINSILLDEEGRNNRNEKMRRSEEYQGLLEEYQAGQNSFEEMQQLFQETKSDDIYTRALGLLLQDIKHGFVKPPSVQKKTSRRGRAVARGDNVEVNFHEHGVTARPVKKLSQSVEAGIVFPAADPVESEPVAESEQVSTSTPETSRVKSLSESPKIEAESLELAPAEKDAQSWLSDKLGLSSNEVYGELRGEKRKQANKKIVESTASLWRYFIDAKKWHVDKAGKYLEIEEKNFGDIDAKVALGFIKQAGLDKYIIEQIELVKTKKELAPVTSWANAAESKEFAGFDKGLNSEDRACASEVLYRLLTAGRVLNKDDEVYSAATQIAHQTVYNEIINTKDQLLNSSKTLRGMSRFLSYGTLCAYIREHESEVKGSTEVDQLDKILDREITEKEAEKYNLIRKRDKKNTRNALTNQKKTVEAAQKILGQDETILRQAGHIADSSEWGKLFVNIVTSEGEQFPGGAMAVKAWGGYDGYLQIDEKNNSYVFRTFMLLKEDQISKLKLPGGQWAYNMYIKARGGNSVPLSKEEILKQLGVEVTPVVSPAESAPDVKSAPATELVSEEQEQDEKMPKTEVSGWIDETGIEFSRKLTIFEKEIKDDIDNRARKSLVEKANQRLTSGYPADDREEFIKKFIDLGMKSMYLIQVRLEKYQAANLPVKKS